jgi:hypothetical protein
VFIPDLELEFRNISISLERTEVFKPKKMVKLKEIWSGSMGQNGTGSRIRNTDNKNRHIWATSSMKSLTDLNRLSEEIRWKTSMTGSTKTGVAEQRGGARSAGFY